MNRKKIIAFAKRLGYPIVLLVRACRAYKQVRYWQDNVVGGRIQVRTKCPDGVFTIDARSVLANVAFTGIYEEHLMKRLPEQKIGDGLIVNIGANIGFYSVQLAKAFPNHSVLAIEPNPEAFELLNINIEQNGLAERIRTVRACVGDAVGKVRLAYIKGKPEYSSIGGIVHECTRLQMQNEVDAEVFPLAALLDGQKVSMIIMDVEGAEMLVFRGAEEVLANDHPLIICECEELLLNKFGHSSKELVQLLEKHGYQVANEMDPAEKISFPFTGNIIARHHSP